MDRAASSAQVDLLYASFTQSNENLMGFDAAALVETIEHVAPNNLSAVEFAVFACYRPKVVIVTTPNQEYNINYGIGPGKFRHLGHQFEWSRRKFQRWSNGVACRNGYSVIFLDIGEPDPILGSPTQMAKFTLICFEE